MDAIGLPSVRTQAAPTEPRALRAQIKATEKTLSIRLSQILADLATKRHQFRGNLWCSISGTGISPNREHSPVVRSRVASQNLKSLQTRMTFKGLCDEPLEAGLIELTLRRHDINMLDHLYGVWVDP